MHTLNKTQTKGLNFWMLTALVTGMMIGSGIFTLPANLAAFGSISLLAWGLTATGAILLALIFAELSLLIPKTGGPYAYCHLAFGDFIGFQIAYNYWFALWTGNAAIVVTCVGYIAAFFPTLQQNPWAAFAIKVGIIWFMTGINLLGTRNASILQIITTILKIIPLLLVGLVGLAFIHPEHYHAFNVSNQSNLSALGTTATLTLWSFLGLEAATVPADDVPHKSMIAQATIAGTLIAATIDILCIVVLMGIMPLSTLAHSTAPFVDAVKILFPAHQQGMAYLIALGAIISCIGTLNSSILLQGQIPKAAAMDGLFPAYFAKSNQSNTPVVSLIFSSLLITLLLLLTINSQLLQQFQLLILMATFASLIPYLFTTWSAMVLFKKNKKIILLAIPASGYALWALISTGTTVILYGLLFCLSGTILYYGRRYLFGEIPAKNMRV